MIPQGSSIIDTKYIDSLVKSINNVQTPVELQKLVTESFASISAVKASLQTQLDSLTPILALLTPPGNLGQILSWAQNFITHIITPMVKPTITIASQITETLAAIAALTAAITAATDRIRHLHPNISITIPHI